MLLSRHRRELFFRGSIVSAGWLDRGGVRATLTNVLSPVLRTNASASYWVRLASVKNALSSVASKMKLFLAAWDCRAVRAFGIASCLYLLCG